VRDSVPSPRRFEADAGGRRSDSRATLPTVDGPLSFALADLRCRRGNTRGAPPSTDFCGTSQRSSSSSMRSKPSSPSSLEEVSANSPTTSMAVRRCTCKYWQEQKSLMGIERCHFFPPWIPGVP
jgi:hypothetical protein